MSDQEHDIQLEVSPENLADSRALEPDVVRWVARNIDVRDPSPAECPDPFAWTLLRMCRGSATFLTWFVDKLWSKLIPSRSQIDQSAPKAFDGKPTLDLIARIEEMRAEAELVSTAPGPPLAREIPSAFEAYAPEG